MRRFLYLSGLFIIIAVIVWQCAQNSTNPERTPPRALSSAELQLVDSDNTFGFKLFKQIVADQPDSNIFISPLSVAMALGMTYNAALGTTREAMDSVLELNGMDIQAVNESYQSLIDLLVNLDPSVIFEIANSIWYRDTFQIAQDFVALNQNYFYAVVNALDFNDIGAADIINAWVSDNTHGKISEIVDSPIDPVTVMFLINAIYFNGTWTYRFDPGQTYGGNFTLPDGSQSPCQMMLTDCALKYFTGGAFRAVDIPYGDGLYSMTILLPNPQTDINSIIAGMNQQTYEEWLEEFNETQVQLHIPKFKLEYEDSLKNDLCALGMGIAFNPGAANFLGMIDPDAVLMDNLFISKVKHKTFIRVDEEGTEAAAVTSVEVEYGSIGPIELAINRPFVFFIRENHSGTILFMGKIVRPDWE